MHWRRVGRDPDLVGVHRVRTVIMLIQKKKIKVNCSGGGSCRYSEPDHGTALSWQRLALGNHI